VILSTTGDCSGPRTELKAILEEKGKMEAAKALEEDSDAEENVERSDGDD